MKKALLSMVIMIAIFLAACTAAEDKTTNPEEMAQAETETRVEVTKDNSKGTEDASESADIDIAAILEKDVFNALDKNLIFEFEVLSEGETANMVTYLTPALMRVDTAPDTSENVVAVYNFTDETAFFYIPSEGYGATMSEVELFDFYEYQSEILENADSIQNLKRTTLNGWDVIYGEADIDGGHIGFWYSEEYTMLMKSVVKTPEGETMYFMITKIEMPESIDAAVFEKPTDIFFIDADESPTIGGVLDGF